MKQTKEVTPCVGVWIETYDACRSRCFVDVTPCVGVWIETNSLNTSFPRYVVTPCVGVWIETSWIERTHYIEVVTPCVGVWIETFIEGAMAPFLRSHPAWVCGLKLGLTKISL